MSLAVVSMVWAQAPAERGGQDEVAEGPLARAVRQATEPFRDSQAAGSAGYVVSGGCVSGPERGAMGVHFVNAALVGDGVLDASRPEVLVYEPRNNRMQLVAAEFIVLAEQWDASNPHPPVLDGQHFHYVSAPNRTGLPAYYELHVWAWKRNPNGTFADWNPQVSCDAYVPGGD
jgi:hypothetical protein